MRRINLTTPRLKGRQNQTLCLTGIKVAGYQGSKIINGFDADKTLTQVIRGLETSYDYVILDLPPLVPFSDANVIAHLVTGFLLIIDVRVASLQTVEEALSMNPGVSSRLFGCVFNRVDNSFSHRLRALRKLADDERGTRLSWLWRRRSTG